MYFFLYLNFLCACHVDLIQPLTTRNNKRVVVVVGELNNSKNYGG